MNNFKQFKKMFSAQLKLTLREKQAWFWGIFFPVILMVIFMVIFSGSSRTNFNLNCDCFRKFESDIRNDVSSNQSTIHS